MQDDRYERDILAWSLHQADLLRRVASGKRVNDVDWSHVVEEIEDVGLSQLNAVRSCLRQMLVHLLKLHLSPDSAAANHWGQGVMTFQADAEQRFSPPMRQLIDVDAIYARAARQVRGAEMDGVPAVALPDRCPVGLDALLTQDVAGLVALFAAGGGGRPL